MPKKTTGSYEEKKIKALYSLYNKGLEKEAFNKAHQILKTTKNNRTISSANLLLAYYFNKKAVIDSSIYYTYQSLKFNTVENDSLKIRLYSLAYNLLATNYKKRGLLGESKKWHLKGIEVSQKYNEKNLFYTHTHGLALVYSELGDYKNALKLFKQCLAYKEDPELIYGSYINIGDIYSAQKEYEISNQYLKKANILCQQENNHNCKAVIAISMAGNFEAQHKTTEALRLYNEAILIADENEYNQIALIARLSTGKIYLESEKYEKAKTIFISGLDNALKLGLLHEQTIIYKALKDIYIAQDDYKNAYHYNDKYYKIKDSITQLQNQKEINELDVKYKTSQKEKEIKVLQFENATKKLTLENQTEAIKNMLLQEEISKKINENTILFFQNSSDKKRNEISLLKKDQQLKALEISQQKETRIITIIAFLLLLIPITGLLFQYYKRLKAQRLVNSKQAEISSQKINTLLKEQELKLIKASISGQDKERKRISQELHDSIGGSLAAIKLQLNHVAKSNFSTIDSINKQLDETYQQVRNLSHTLLPKKFSNNKFCEVLQSYFNNISSASKLQIDFHTYPKKEINDMNEVIQIEVFKIIQELLTNTIKHAKATQIDIQFNLIENDLNILFEDNGTGFDTEHFTRGIGFINLENRTKQLQGSFLIDSKLKRGTIINIEIPITSDANTINDVENELYTNTIL
ncbi:tetratricopeptide repeat-containing sensor histidine kinase [Flavobacterium hydrocarbonoxydans]|nr:tetratricopeptide repeat-containing sensor histidine kinase [Flavobacterium hydrocarbonoxydans]